MRSLCPHTVVDFGTCYLWVISNNLSCMLFIFMFFISWIPIYFIRCSALCGVKLNKEGTEKDVKLKFVTSLEAKLKRL